MSWSRRWSPSRHKQAGSCLLSFLCCLFEHWSKAFNHRGAVLQSPQSITPVTVSHARISEEIWQSNWLQLKLTLEASTWLDAYWICHVCQPIIDIEGMFGFDWWSSSFNRNTLEMDSCGIRCCNKPPATFYNLLWWYNLYRSVFLVYVIM